LTELATYEKTFLAFEPISRTATIRMTKMTASARAYSATHRHDHRTKSFDLNPTAHSPTNIEKMLVTGENRRLHQLAPFLPLSAAIALNIRLRVCLTVATPFDGMACKVKSRLSQINTFQLGELVVLRGRKWFLPLFPALAPGLIWFAPTRLDVQVFSEVLNGTTPVKSRVRDEPALNESQANPAPRREYFFHKRHLLSSTSIGEKQL
jgi:hypothetical protein